jgi:CubicO group peptidase (beta-lactamase class C family)
VGVEQPLSLVDLEDIEVIANALEVQKPFWAPGSKQGYHAVTYGLFVAVLFRKITGISIGTFLQDEIAKPLGADVFLGLPASEDGRAATLYPQGKRGLVMNILPRLFLSRKTEGKVYRAAAFDKDSFTAIAFRNPADLGARGVQNFNRTRVRRQELPWANALGSARGLARVYQALANGGVDDVQLVRPETVEMLVERDSFSEEDDVLKRPMGFSYGFVKEDPGVFGSQMAAFGHPGAGGALGWADPVRRVSIAYIPNAMDFRIRSPRTISICDAIYASLA